MTQFSFSFSYSTNLYQQQSNLSFNYGQYNSGSDSYFDLNFGGGSNYGGGYDLNSLYNYGGGGNNYGGGYDYGNSGSNWLQNLFKSETNGFYNFSNIYDSNIEVDQNIYGHGNNIGASGLYTEQNVAGSGNYVEGDGFFSMIQNIMGYNNTAVTHSDNAQQHAYGSGNTLVSEGNSAYQTAFGGDNTLIATGKDNIQVTGAGNDTIVTGGGQVHSGAGNDHIVVNENAGNTAINAGAGDDVIDITMGKNQGNIKIDGGEGHDQVNITDATTTDTKWDVDFNAQGENTAFTIKVGDQSYVISNDVEALNIKNANGDVILNVDNVAEWRAQQLAAQQPQ